MRNLPASWFNYLLVFLAYLLINIVIKYCFHAPLGVLLPLWPPFPLIAKVGAFERGMKDNCNKVVRALSFHFIKILIKLLQSHINTGFKEAVVCIPKILLSSYKDLAKKLYVCD